MSGTGEVLLSPEKMDWLLDLSVRLKDDPEANLTREESEEVLSLLGKFIVGVLLGLIRPSEMPPSITPGSENVQ